MADKKIHGFGQMELLALSVAAILACAPVAYSSVRASISVEHTVNTGRAAELCASTAELISAGKGDLSGIMPDGMLCYDSDWEATIPSSPDVPPYTMLAGTLPHDEEPGHGMMSVVMQDEGGQTLAVSWASWQEELP